MSDFIKKLKYNKVTSKINFNNISYIEKFKVYYKSKYKTESNKELKEIFRNYLKSNGLKNFSIFNKNYYLHLGYNKKEANDIVFKIQSNNAKKRQIKYTKKELSEQSVWSKEFWKKKGYSEKEAHLNVLSNNYSSAVGYSKEAYNKVLNDLSIKTKKAHKRGCYINSYNMTSNEEIEFFKWVSNFSKIKHNTLWVNVKKSQITNKSGYSIDGYLKTEHGLIGIEYDGIYWHNIKRDNIRDREIFECRKDIIGIIRISSRYFKQNKKEQVKKDILYGIEEIKNKTRKKIRYY